MTDRPKADFWLCSPRQNYTPSETYAVGFLFWELITLCSYSFGARRIFLCSYSFGKGRINSLSSNSFRPGGIFVMIYSFCARGLSRLWLIVLIRTHFSTEHHGDLQRMWCRIGTVTKSAPESRVRCCCCGAVVAVLLSLMCCCFCFFAVLLLCCCVFVSEVKSLDLLENELQRMHLPRMFH